MNYLFIIMHDIGRRYGCYGNSQIVTPNIDKLAEESVRFNNHYCQFPLCGPSRANIFSGLRPLFTERFDNEAFFPKFREALKKQRGMDLKTLPELFKENGYETFGAGLVFHDVDDPLSWSKGFFRPELPKLPEGLPKSMRVFNENSPNPWVNRDSFDLITIRMENLKKMGIPDEEIFTPSGLRKVKGPPVESGEVDDSIYFDGQTTERIVRYIREVNEQRPFFIAAGFTAAHLPWNSPSKYWDLYDRESLERPENREPPLGTTDWAMGDSEPAQYYTQHGYEKPWLANREQSLELMHGYYAAISYIDTMVGRLIDALKEKGLYDDTAIILVSDHGFHTAEHGYWGKHNLWDKSLEVPLLIRVPTSANISENINVVPGPRSNGLTEHVDIFPTLCDMAGIEPPGYLQGNSLLPLMKEPQASGQGGKEAVFSHRKHQWHDRIKAYSVAHSVRAEEYRYSVYLDNKENIIYEELFDYKNDPFESRNLARDSSYRIKCIQLRNLIDKKLKEDREKWQY